LKYNKVKENNMKIITFHDVARNLKLSLLFVLATIIIYSCKKDKSNPNFEYLQSSNNVEEIPVSTAKNLFNALGILYPASQPIASRCVYNFTVYKVTYSTTFKNAPIIASGLICVPKSSGSFPLLSFQNGTNTKNANAPSIDLTNSSFELIEGMASTGYIILIPDYIGFGASSNILHPYHHRESNNSAIIDLINAAEEFLSEKPGGASGNGKLYLMGYSQGGWATLSVLDELEKHPIATEQIQAASCGAGSYDLIAMTNYLREVQTFPTPLYLPYFAESHLKNGFISTALNTIFKEPYATRIPGLFDGMHDAGAIDAQLNDTIAKFLTDSLLLNFSNSSTFSELRNELTINSVPAWKTTTRIFFAAGTADKDVPSFISQNTFDAFKNIGVDSSQIRLSLYPDLDHGSALIPWGFETFNWFSSLK
jgi:pimeloyl-ACP methyl ester carboxylesterase